MTGQTVSVVIPCYNQSEFVSDAITSVNNQSCPVSDIIVVDDGSEDDVQTVISGFRNVSYVYQKNAGLSSARNTGLNLCHGDYVVFLDSDDRLLPCAIEAGLKAFSNNPESAFVSGHFRYINRDGTFLSEYPQKLVEHDHYQAFLKGNYIGMHAAVMYKTDILKKAGGFDTRLKACEDYELYLRLSKDYSVSCYPLIIAEYRQHGRNMSADYELMLSSVLRVLNSQLKFIRREKRLRKAFRTGKREWIVYFGSKLLKQSIELSSDGKIINALQLLFRVLRYSPAIFFGFLYTSSFLEEEKV